MATNHDVMLAIMALDAYNRGYGEGLIIDGSGLGNWALGLSSSLALSSASFFAQTYNYNGQTIISYRGIWGQPPIARIGPSARPFTHDG